MCVVIDMEMEVIPDCGCFDIVSWILFGMRLQVIQSMVTLGVNFGFGSLFVPSFQCDSTKMEQTKQRAVAAEKNSELLSQRSATVLAGARDLLPTITEAEHRYFQQIRRYAGFCDKWEKSVEQLSLQSGALCGRMEVGEDGSGARCEVRLGERELMLCHDLLHGQDMLLKRSARTVEEMERRVQEFGLFGEEKKVDGNGIA